MHRFSNSGAEGLSAGRSLFPNPPEEERLEPARKGFPCKKPVPWIRCQMPFEKKQESDLFTVL